MKSKEEIESGLSQFCGTSYYHQVSNSLVLTDGVKYLCEEAGMYWFTDIINSVLVCDKKIFAERFLVAKLVVKDGSAVFTIDDGNYCGLYKQVIEYTNCPLDKVSVFIEDSGRGFKVALLPMEH